MSLFSRSRVLSKAICVEYQVENGGLHIRTLGTRAALSTGCCAVPSDTGCPLSSSLACSVSSPAIGREAQGFGRRLMPSQSLVAALGLGTLRQSDSQYHTATSLPKIPGCRELPVLGEYSFTSTGLYTCPFDVLLESELLIVVL